jgi:transcriptional regulator with XRE-family HTH domain
VHPTPFGIRLRALRLAAGLSQRELARLARVSVGCVGSLERGERAGPHPHTLGRIMDALDLPNEVRDDLSGLLPERPPRPLGRQVRPSPDGVPAERSTARAPVLAERAAAWELYVELVTRVAVSDLEPNQGLLREAFSSLHSLFDTARGILRKHGETAASLDGRGLHEMSRLTIAILNQVLRPVLSEWHPLLQEHEARRPSGVSAAAHERAWRRNHECRMVLAQVRATLDQYATRLAALAGVVPAHVPVPPLGER